MQKFEWDESKRLKNIEKHHIDFYDAIEIFKDVHRLEFSDIRENYGESRFQTIGKIQNSIVIFVVWTKRSKIRIISARIAKIKERNLYYENQN